MKDLKGKNEPKRRTSSSTCSLLMASDIQHRNQSPFSISKIVTYQVPHSVPETTPTFLVHRKGYKLRFKSQHLRLLAVVTLGYTLIAGVLLYYYSSTICDERECNTTSIRPMRMLVIQSGVKTRGDVNISLGLGKEGDSQSPKLPGIKADDKQSVDQIQAQRTVMKGAGHTANLKQVLPKVPADLVGHQAVDKVAVSVSRMTTIRKREERVLNENVMNSPANTSVKVRCKGESVAPSLTRLHRTALASSPGSGNTWTRHLLQQATGISTGSIYSDAGLKSKGFLGEGLKADTCLVVKTHEWQKNYQYYFKRAILILRHPRDSVVSSFHFFNGGGHVKEAKPKLFHTDRWVRFAEERIRFWFGLNYDWVTKYRNPLHIIFYEELKANPILQIERAVHFLNFTMTETDKKCMKNNLEGHFQRQHKNVIDVDELYNESLSASMDRYVEQLKTAIQDRFPGKPVVWTSS